MPGSYERKNKKLAKYISPSGKVKCSNPKAHNLIQIPVAGDGLQKRQKLVNNFRRKLLVCKAQYSLIIL